MDSPFYDKYKPEPDAIRDGSIQCWVSNLSGLHKRGGERLHNRIRDTRINIAVHPYSIGVDSYTAKFIKGYSTYRSNELIGDGEQITLMSTYSPLLKSFVGIYSSITSYRLGLGYEPCYYLSYLPDIGPRPADDDSILRAVMAEQLSDVDPHTLPQIVLKESEAVSGYLLSELERLTSIADPTIALVSCIRKLSSHKRNKILELFDKHGPPSGILGEALLHIDKFRTS